MTAEEQKYIDSIPQDEFAEVCEELWRADRCPLNGDMICQILEDYNNIAIDVLVARMPAADLRMLERYTASDLIHWLRNGYECGPFVDPEDILEADPRVEVNYNVGEDREVSVYDPTGKFYVVAPLDDLNEIVWESWKAVETCTQ